MNHEIVKKVVSYHDGVTLAHALKTGCFRLVITTGCFDRFHVGHCRFLEAASRFGDHLMVGVLVDWAVEALMGRQAPKQPLAERMEIVAALGCVDSVVPIEAATATGFISDTSPAVWVKGGSYTVDTLDPNELAAARHAEARVEIVPYAISQPTKT